jgi:hypothetical protein
MQTASTSRPVTSRAATGYEIARLLSIDVALAALGGGVMAVRVIGTSPRSAFFLLLPLSVWVVYTLDHLLDAQRMGSNAPTPRHRFHFTHRWWLSITVAMIAVFCDIVGLVELSWSGVYFGIGIASLFGVHELLVKFAGDRASPLLMKEIGVAVIFTAGTWGLPLVLHLQLGRRIDPAAVILMLQYLLLAIVNLIEFSIYEHKLDTRGGQTSFVRGIGRARARWIAQILLGVQPLLAVVTVIFHPSAVVWTAQVIDLTMAVGLASILLFPRFFARTERYRMVGDGVFVLPLLMWVV